jgi:hypothetical protein
LEGGRKMNVSYGIKMSMDDLEKIFQYRVPMLIITPVIDGERFDDMKVRIPWTLDFWRHVEGDRYANTCAIEFPKPGRPVRLGEFDCVWRYPHHEASREGALNIPEVVDLKPFNTFVVHSGQLTCDLDEPWVSAPVEDV